MIYIKDQYSVMHDNGIYNKFLTSPCEDHGVVVVGELQTDVEGDAVIADAEAVRRAASAASRVGKRKP